MRLQPAIMCGSLAAFLSGTGSLARPLDVVKSSGSLSSGQYDSVKRSLRGPLNRPINDGEDERGNFAAAYDSAVENLRSLGPTAEALRAEEIENIADSILAEYMHQEMYAIVLEFIKKPELEKWTELMIWDKFTSRDDESALEKSFFNRYTFDELRDFIAAARKFPPAGLMAHKVESWLLKKHPFFLMRNLVRGYNKNTLETCPELYKWFDYLAHYNERYAEKQSTVSNTLKKFYNDENLVNYFEELRKEYTTKELTSEEHAWLETATPPEDVFTKLHLHIKGDGFFNKPNLPKQITKMNDFYEVYPKLQIPFRRILPYTDEKLLDMVFFEVKLFHQ
ncbi:unnamed protein product [Peronospora belbahrii]|uniref:RxLR effector candidate protein n=1 Tax=Peronospora belbahrii TaxID=622444 RepID=A0ABN8D876_9STRA|nr:unnamed protein product [Peronospora belbahrii]